MVMCAFAKVLVWTYSGT